LVSSGGEIGCVARAIVKYEDVTLLDYPIGACTVGHLAASMQYVTCQRHPNRRPIWAMTMP